MANTNEREAFDEAIVNMTVRSSRFYQDYVFYMHLLSKCRVVFNTQLPAAAGVAFMKDHYVLYLNPLETIQLDKNNSVLGFSMKMPLEHRVGILKHEMLHICLGHLLRVEERDFKKYNLASDCALNQEIDRAHLPNYGIFPDNLPVEEKVVAKWKETAEYYYDLIPDKEGDDGDKEGEGGSGPGKGNHEIWKSSEGDGDFQKEVTKQIVEDAGNQTVKSKGTLPSSYADMLDGLTVKREVDWKKVLRRVVGNKKANTRKTIMRRNRRMPHAGWIKGTTKDRIFELGVVSDVSGSVGDNALLDLWGSVIHICELYNTPVQMVQVDTTACKPEPLTRKTKQVTRKARGGTMLAPAIDEFKKAGVNFDALVVTTDGYLYKDDIEPFRALNKTVIWLIEPDGQIMKEMNQGKMIAIKLKNDKKSK
jgi:predicted metal-dependent peptidase